VELVIVILILGILAAVAAPRMFDTAGNARTNATRHSLSVVRDAIQLYRAQNNALPGELGTEADLKADLTTMLNGPFPRAEVGNLGDTIRIQTSGAALGASGTESWAYDNVSGQFMVNHATGATW
jgi:general secretion pathway protein G